MKGGDTRSAFYPGASQNSFKTKVALSKTSWEWGAVGPRGRADEPKEPQRPAEGCRLSPARRFVRASPNFRWRTEATVSATHRRPYFRRGK